MRVYEQIIDTPLGAMRLWASDAGLLRADFADSDHTDLQGWARRMLGAYDLALGADHPILIEAQMQLRAYFAGECGDFVLPIDLRGTPFQCQVWHTLCSIAAGRMCSYQRMAERIGHPRAIRAVGAANAANPISVIIPCHRLIGSDGRLRGYGGGLQRKQALIEHERRWYHH